MRVLLDTCTFLWIAADDSALSVRARRVFSDPSNEVFLSSVSVWEISVKHFLGKLPLPDPVDVFVPEQREAHGITPLALEEEDVLQLGRLPSHHRDPFDRMLICQAMASQLIVLSPDPLIRAYPIQTLW